MPRLRLVPAANQTHHKRGAGPALATPPSAGQAKEPITRNDRPTNFFLIATVHQMTAQPIKSHLQLPPLA